MDLLLDWAPDYANILAGAASGDAVGGALQDVCEGLAGAGGRVIRLYGPGHLSAGLAVGYTFSRPSGFRLEVAHQAAWWAADGDAGRAGVRVTAQQLDPGSPDIALTLAISRPEIVRDVDAAIPGLELPIGGRIVVTPEGGARRDAICTDSHARGIVHEITEALMRRRADWGIRGATHIFMAAPFAFATLLGHALNGFGPLHLYEPKAGSSGYVEALRLA